MVSDPSASAVEVVLRVPHVTHDHVAVLASSLSALATGSDAASTRPHDEHEGGTTLSRFFEPGLVQEKIPRARPPSVAGEPSLALLTCAPFVVVGVQKRTSQ
jgi:hypothetical protein